MTNDSTQATDTEDALAAATGTGWLLPMPGNLVAAVGESEMIYVFPFEPEIFSIPNTPSYARGVIAWRDRLVPLIDLNIFLHPENEVVVRGEDSAETPPDTAEQVSAVGESAIEELVALFVFQPPSGSADATGLGALLLSTVPERVVVADDHGCELPDDLSVWNALAISCFEDETRGPIPILDLAALFAADSNRDTHNKDKDDSSTGLDD